MHTGAVRSGQDTLGIAYDASKWQRILSAQPVPSRSHQRDCWVPVLARIVWERDGDEVVETRAFAWVPRLVLVELRDTRYLFRGVWLDRSDIQRL